MILRELFALIGLEVDAASFVKGVVAVEGVRDAYNLLVRGVERAAQAMVGVVTQTAAHADAVDELAQSAGVSAQQLQELTYVGGFAGLSLQDMSQALSMLARKGIKDVNAYVYEFADRIQKLDPAARVDAAVEAFGRAGARMVPVLAEGSAHVRAMVEQGQRFGVILSDDTISAGVRFEDSMRELSELMTGISRTIGAELLPVVNGLVREFSDWFQANRAVIAQDLRAVVGGIGAAMGALWGVIFGVTRAMTWLTDAGWALWAPLAALSALIFSAVIPAMWAAGAESRNLWLWKVALRIASLREFAVERAQALWRMAVGARSLALMGLRYRFVGLGAAWAAAKTLFFMAVQKAQVVLAAVQTFGLGTVAGAYLGVAGAAISAAASAAWAGIVMTAAAIAPFLPWAALIAIIALVGYELYALADGQETIFHDIASNLRYLAEEAWGSLKALWGNVPNLIDDSRETILEKVRALGRDISLALVDAFTMGGGSRLLALFEAQGIFEPGAPAARPPLISGGAASPAAAVAIGGTSNSTVAPRFNANITVSVPPGTDAAGVGTAVSSELRSWYNTEMPASFVAVQQD